MAGVDYRSLNDEFQDRIQPKKKRHNMVMSRTKSLLEYQLSYESSSYWCLNDVFWFLEVMQPTLFVNIFSYYSFKLYSLDLILFNSRWLGAVMRFKNTWTSSYSHRQQTLGISQWLFFRWNSYFILLTMCHRF